MINYQFGALKICFDCYGYLYFGNLNTHIRVGDNYFRIYNALNTSFYRLEIFTEPEEINYVVVFHNSLPVSFCKSFNVGKFYFMFVCNV